MILGLTRLAIATSLIEKTLAPGARATINALIEPLFPAQGPLLDAGCGPRPQIERTGLVGIDINPNAARAYGRFAPALVADATALPFEEGCFAGVSSVGLLHHLPDEKARLALREMLRVARPGAIIAVVDGLRCSAPRRRPFAAGIRALDRGSFMRDRGGHNALLAAVADWRTSFMTYSWTGLEGVLAVHMKE